MPGIVHDIARAEGRAPRGAQAKVIIDKLHKGASLTDHEINFGAQFFRQLSDELLQCGPLFELPQKEADRIVFALEGFKSARQI